MDDDGRYKIFVLPEHLLPMVLQGIEEYQVFRWPPPEAFHLPADARIVQVSHDIHRRAFLLMVHSREFKPVPPGLMVPIHDEPLKDHLFVRRPITDTHERA